MQCTQLNQRQTFANPDNGAASSHVWSTFVLDDGLPVIDCNMICEMQCHCDKTRIPFGAIEAASNTDSDSSFVATERRLDRPLGTAHSAAVKCPNTKCALPSVRWTQLFSSLWPDLLDNPEVCHHIRHWVYWEQNMLASCLVLAAWGFKTHPLASGLCIWLWGNVISFGWSSLGIWKGAWNVSSYLLRPCLQSTHFKLPGSPTDLCRCLPWFLAHRHRQGHAGRGLLRMLAHLSGSWSNLCIDVQKFRKGLSAVHSDKSAANILQAQTMAQPAVMFGLHCTGWQVASDRLYYANAVSLRQEKDPLFGAIEAASNTDSDSSFAATETMR